jgi:hypothetical protein
MTLNIEGDAGLGQQDQQVIHNKWDTIDEVQLNLALLGFFPMEKPDFAAPSLNAELYQALCAASGNTLTFEHTRFSAWYSYAQDKLGFFVGHQKQIENEMTEIRTRTKRAIVQRATKATAKKPTVEAVDEEAQLDPRYMELKLMLQKVEQSIDLLEANAKMFSAGTRLTSRAVTVRGQELEGLNGGRAYGNRYRPDGGM